jgi:citrate synthase
MSLIEADVPPSKPLFTITEAMLDTGLRGFPLGTVRTSHVTPDLGVTYCGYPVEDLKDLAGEDVVYLLFLRRCPRRSKPPPSRPIWPGAA